VAPGDVRAFDVRSSREVWRFHTVPRPGKFGNDTWEGDSWKDRSGANAWGGASLDEKRGMVFVGLGSGAYDFYGGDRKGQNLFANSVVALDASTGRRIWHFQTLHHELWDHDLAVYPNLVRVTHASKQIDAVAQVGKRGYVFLFDRVTGKPLFEIEVRPVPPSDVPSEEAWPTQPIPVKPPPFERQNYGEDGLTNISQQAHDALLKQYRKIRSGSAFNPPSLEGTLIVPGFYGGASWSGASFDPPTGVLYVNSNNVLHVLTLGKAKPGKVYPYKRIPSPLFRNDEGYPGNEPPWGGADGHRPQPGRVSVRDAAGRVSGAHSTWNSTHRNLEFRGNYRHQRRTRFHRSQWRRKVPRFRQGDGADPVGVFPSGRQLCHAQHLHG